MARIAESLAHQTLQIDVHMRKWNVVIHGIDGPAEEEEGVTRTKCVNFALEVLKVADVDAWHLAACHRLSRKANAGIILRFTDLAQRDRWLTGTKNLRGHNKKISFSVDLPPILRPLKDSLMLMRSRLEPNIKSKSRVRHLPQWPFVELHIEGQSPKQPQEILARWNNYLWYWQNLWSYIILLCRPHNDTSIFCNGPADIDLPYLTRTSTFVISWNINCLYIPIVNYDFLYVWL